ncbi:hypothetical protein KR51_00021720 [Rubidibacter lacunae KORDI 51-2]|uniref:Polyketide cyclase / dehydrase and lipid transport n=1 Tax=Rubidibacter lacunae KORDI 51-2 TaxID=582515 RepID=U5DK44_9CHRO|nr:SRPBCC domain-containing protein [Rubidibacter lacunae]ERN41282.1 hypothetical protein KR51_00021720 [Rubidibacter lacunae KORDI 51-2]
MASLYTEIDINAPKSVVWDLLLAKEQWQLWNTFLFDGDASQPLLQGKRVLLSMRRLAHEEKTEFQPRVMLVLPEICLKWQASIPGLKSETVFELQEIGFRRTKYVHAHHFSGFLAPILIPFVREDEAIGLRRMARELKRYAELNQ